MKTHGLPLSLGSAFLALWVSTLSGAETKTPSLALLPPTISLSGSEASQRVMVVEVDAAGEFLGEVSAGASVQSSDTEVAAIRDGRVIPTGNGKTTLQVRLSDGREARAEVEVKGFDRDHAWSFRNHVMPVVSKAGCNMGACHGAVAGKGGLRLSLRGYDPERDYQRITREVRGRRVELGDPGRSLFLTKGTTAVKHTGGRRIEPGSRDYRIIAEWIAAGAEAPEMGDARIESLEIFPPLSSLERGDRQRLIVRARYSDGREEDVTQWAKFSSANEAVALVSEAGVAEVIGNGEGAVTAWFSSRIVMARLSVPWPNEIPEEVFTDAPRRHFIDDRVLDQLQRLNLKPSPRADDSDFLRRAYLDTIGVLPTVGEARAFFADEDPKKRDKLIDALLEREEFVDYWAYRVSDMMLVSGRKLRPDAVKAYYEWVRRSIAENKPWDQFAREVVTARGNSVEEGATNFYAVHQDPETMAENVSQTFLSLSLNCAKCHDHPLEKWTNDQYYAFANLFSRVRAKGWGGDARSGDGVRTIYVEPRGDLIQPRTGKPQPPAPLDAEPLAEHDTGDRREVLAEWLTDPGNDLFSRSLVNKVWANYFGIGLVDPVDDLRASNPASNEPLLADLSEYFVEQGFDLRELMRVILKSETYQRSSVPLYENEEDDRFFSRQYPRRLIAEVIHDAVAGITGVPSQFTNIKISDGSKQKTEFYPEGTRALQLFDASVDSYFLDTFGRNEREISCECERSNQPSLVQVLHVSNGQTVNEKLASEKSIVTELMKQDDATVVEEAWLSCLSRLPTEEERDGFLDILSETQESERRAAIEDLFWSLMSSREFLFQH